MINWIYEDLKRRKAYCDMDIAERDYCKDAEAEYFLPMIGEMRRNGSPEEFISACLEDLFSDSYICDVANIQERAKIPEAKVREGQMIFFEDFDSRKNLLKKFCLMG